MIKFLLAVLRAAVSPLYVVDAIKSASITNRDATPRTINSAHKDGGRIRIKQEVGSLVTAAAEAASTIRFFSLRSNDCVVGMTMDAGSMGTGCTMDIGIYRNTVDGAAVRDADFFASAVDMATAQRGTNVLHESGVVGITDRAKPLWEQLGYTVDPQCEFDVVGTLAVAATVAGAVWLRAQVVGGH